MPDTRPRRIAHLDMDAFFASVELLSYPQLRGTPVVVGGAKAIVPDHGARFARLKEYSGRGVVTTSTYEARALGVFSGMGLMHSARLAPDAILLPARFDAYRDASRKFKAAVADIAPLIEDRGIDEIYIDLTDIPEATHPLIERIKTAVFAATGLTCSVGIAPNKLLAKICSDLNKPNGITVLTAADIPTRIWPLPASKINGIGKKTAERLQHLHISTIGELAQTPADLLIRRFGPHIGVWLHNAANGIDEHPVITWRAPKSISRETTFERDLHVRHDRAELSQQFTALCERLAQDLARKGYMGRSIGVKLRFADFRLLTREITCPQPICQAADLRRVASQCLKRIPFDTAAHQRIRLLGVRCGSLADGSHSAPSEEPDAARLPTSNTTTPQQGELAF
ncbi:DNA polymerase IV [Betaproteobacteria bacterium]|nr:DNA polymerase IV [Betaproteobacteria bacterium]